ncbi:DNA cytosine methyltransferase [Isoptericola sp. b490]|uniref:DNA cytosine methyltransferase n=1 Tax=Actinotalea lenta TaxID=3064654 RepID=UPI0027140711|nr:DNA cytosine methyltransferase [Isoptericola sp. b490]MDO8119722.1 DNA cytosine methyltransferase [Isoptericola sp. b490]
MEGAVDSAEGRPIAVDLYSGVGGLSLGMEQAGFTLAAAAELDPIHGITHRYNFPATPLLTGDLGAGTTATLAQRVQSLIPERREIDAVVGGPPCQGFSVGGVRDDDDVRNDQLLRFVDLVVELQPKVFCLENVAGLLEPRFEPLRKEALRRLVIDGGYEVTGFGAPVNAADFGAPQTRRRVLMMGSRVGDAPTLRPGTGARVTVREALEGLPDIARYRRLLASDEAELVAEDLLALRSVESPYARRLAGLEADPNDRSWPRVFDNALLTNSLRTVHTAKTLQRFRRTPVGGVERISRLYRLDPDRQARTLRAGTSSDRGSHTSPRPIHPVKNRVITVREAARLHGYPDWFRFHATNWHGHRQIGNSVPPPLAVAAGRALLAALGISVSVRPGPALELGDPAWLLGNRVEAEKFLAE